MDSVLVRSIGAVTRRRLATIGTGAPLPQAAGVMEARDALRALATHASSEIWHLRDYIMGVGYR